MAHNTIRSGYGQLVDRLNLFPQGAPDTKLLRSILGLLMNEDEANLLALLPIRQFRAEAAAAVWHVSLAMARKSLDSLASRALLLDMEDAANPGVQLYFLPPPMAGFFEFSMMRVRSDVDQHALGELYYQYMNVEDEFIRALFAQGETQLGRVLVQERALPEPATPANHASRDGTLQVLDYDRASNVIATASDIGIGVCYCRHKMQHVERDCDAPKDICMTFNTTASSLIRHGFARRVDAVECHDLLAQGYDNQLVQFGENVRQQVSFICNCCGCCCEALIAARKFAVMNPVHPTNFEPVIDEATCDGCGKCANACPVEAMSIVSANDPHRASRRKARLNAEICLGCGVCVRVCPKGAISLANRPERVITPVNSAHRAVFMAIERGKLQNLIFDNQAHLSHRAMAAILGVILTLPPVKQALASKQMKSRYLESLLTWARV